MNLSIFTCTPSMTSLGCLKDRSVNCNVTVVGLASSRQSLLKLDKLKLASKGITLLLVDDDVLCTCWAMYVIYKLFS